MNREQARAAPKGQDSSPPRLLTAEEAAEYLRVSISAVYTWVSRGRLPCLRAGSLLRFRQSDLDAWLAGRLRR